MRKQLKLLLLVAMIAVMFVMAMVVSSAAFEVDGTEYATFSKAYAAVEDGGTITMTSDMAVDTTKLLDKDFTVDGAKPDGGKYKLTFNVKGSSTAGLTSGTTAPICVVFKNLDVEVTSKVSSYIGTFGGAQNVGTEFRFENCNVNHSGTLMFTGRGIIQTFHDCTVTTTKLLMKGNNKNDTCVLKLTGNTTVTSSVFLANTEGGGNGVALIVGTEGGNDNVTITAPGLVNDGAVSNTATQQSVSKIYSGNITVTGDAAFNLTYGKVEIYGGTLNLGAGTLGTYKALTVAEDTSKIAINFNTDNSVAKNFFLGEQWLGATINGVIYALGDDPLFEAYVDGALVGQYVTFAEAYAALTEGSGTIKLLGDVVISETISFAGNLVVDGGNYKLTSVVSEQLFANAGGATSSLAFQNITLELGGTQRSLMYGTTSTSCPVSFTDCTINVADTSASTLVLANASVTFHNVIYTGPASLATCGNTKSAVEVTITGNSTFTTTTESTSGLFGTRRVVLTVGSESGEGDNITFNLKTPLATPTGGQYSYEENGSLASAIVINNGTFNLNAAVNLIKINASYCPGTVVINGGIFNAADGAVLFNNSADNTITVNSGEFNFNSSATMGSTTFITEGAAEGAIVINFEEDNVVAEIFFVEAVWLGAKINGEIYSELIILPDLFAVYNGEEFVGNYKLFPAAYLAVSQGLGNKIVLLDNVTLTGALTLNQNVIIDGDGKTLTLPEGITEGWFFTMSAANVTIQNVTLVDSITSGGLFQFTAAGTYTLDGVTASNAAEWFSFTVEGATLLVSNSTLETATTGTTVSSNAKAGAPALMQFTNCTLKAEKLKDDTASAMFTNLGATYVFDSCTALMNADASVPSMFIYGNSLAIDVTIKGATTIVATTTVYLRYGGTLTIGTEGAEDEIVITASRVVRTQRANVEINIYSGTFNLGENGFTYLENSTGDATAQNINIYGGTFILDEERGVFGSKAEGSDLTQSVITITKGTFELSNGATLLGFDLTMDDNVELGDIENAGDITFKLGVGTADKAEVAAFFATDFWVVDAMAHFYITSWISLKAPESVEFSSDFSGTYADYLAKFYETAATVDEIYGIYLDGDDNPYFLTPELAEEYFDDVTMTNFFVAEGAVSDPEFVPFTVVGGAKVTLTDWVLTFDGTVGTVTEGTLILNNCQITGTKAGSPLFVVNGENTALVVNGGVYDLAGLADTNVFELGADKVTYENSTATFKGVTIWTSTSSSKAGIFAYAISELTVEDCLITPYKGIVKGDIHTMPESFTKYVNTIGIRTHAAVAKIKGTEIHGSGSAGAIYVYAGEATITDVITYCFRGVSVKAGATANIYSSTFTSSPFNSNFRGLEADGGTINVYNATFLNRMDIPGGAKHNNYASMAVTKATGVINVYSGTYECAAINGEDANNQSALIAISEAGGKVTVAEGVTLTFSGHGGYVFELVEGAILEVTGATVNVTGTDAVVLTGAGTATFTDCRFNVTNEQAGVLFAAGEFKGKTLVIALEGTQITADVALTAYAQKVLYAGEFYKLWVSVEGSFINGAEAGAGVYVDTANEETSGLRFEVQISAEALAALKAKYGEPVAYYTLIAPMDYIAKAGGVFTKAALENINVEGAKYVEIEAKNTLNEEGGNVSYSGTLIGLNSFTRLYAAIPMIEFAEATVYGEFNSADNARSAQQVAEAIIADMDSEYHNDWTAEQVAIVDKYAGVVAGDEE